MTATTASQDLHEQAAGNQTHALRCRATPGPHHPTLQVKLQDGYSQLENRSNQPFLVLSLSGKVRVDS